MTTKRIITACIVFALIGAGAYAAISKPWKVTDPKDPRFNPDWFSFSDYKTNEELKETFKVLFPVGTSVEFVDRVLVDAGGAHKNDNKNYPHLVHYIYKPYLQVNHTFVFDENNTLLNMHPFGGAKMFEDQPGYKEIKKQTEQRRSHDNP